MDVICASAPSDGLLHLTGEHVVLSITQLLIRRSLFSRTGLFESKWGSVGDFNWEMKAGLLANMVHVPDTWATWRIHSAQATATVDVFSLERSQKIDEMIEDAISVCTPYLAPAIVAGLREQWLPQSKEMRTYYAGLRSRKNTLARRVHQFGQLFHGGRNARSEVLGRLFRKPKWGDIAPAQMRSWLESLGIVPILKLPA